jgi:integrase
MVDRKRRGHNEGTVYYWPERDRWVVQISLGPGKRKKFYCKTKQEAVRKKNEVLRELEQGMLATGSQQKLKDYLDHWLEDICKPNLRISSCVKYEKIIRLYIVPDLGDVQLQKLTPGQVQALYTKIWKRGLSSKTVNSIHGLLHKALDDAVKAGLVSRNVCDSVSSPHVVKRRVKPLALEQARKLLEIARGHRLEVLLTLAVVTGMRRGELIALRWSDVDLERRILLVCHTADYIAHYGHVETEPKTESGLRQISLPAFMIDILRQHRIEQLELRLKVGSAWEDRDLVFCDLHGGYLNSRYLLKMLDRLLESAELPHMHFHDLRHSAASILLSMGVNPKVIQELLGHSDMSITLGTYSHLFPTMQEEAMGKWDDVFGDSSDDEMKNERG